MKTAIHPGIFWDVGSLPLNFGKHTRVIIQRVFHSDRVDDLRANR